MRRDALRAAETDLERDLDALAARVKPEPEQLEVALRRLLATLHEHVDGAHAPGGLLAQVTAEAPWLASRVHQLRDEHGDLLERTSLLLERSAAGETVEGLLVEARDLLASVSGHRHRAAALLLDTYMSDIPAGD